MEQRDRHQCDLDDESGDQQSGNSAPQPEQPRLLAACEEMLHRAALVQGDDRRHRRETQLEARPRKRFGRSEEHTSELQYIMRISYAVFFLKKKNKLATNRLMTATSTLI